MNSQYTETIQRQLITIIVNPSVLFHYLIWKEMSKQHPPLVVPIHANQNGFFIVCTESQMYLVMKPYKQFEIQDRIYIWEIISYQDGMVNNLHY